MLEFSARSLLNSRFSVSTPETIKNLLRQEWIPDSESDAASDFMALLALLEIALEQGDKLFCDLITNQLCDLLQHKAMPRIVRSLLAENFHYQASDKNVTCPELKAEAGVHDLVIYKSGNPGTRHPTVYRFMSRQAYDELPAPKLDPFTQEQIEEVLLSSTLSPTVLSSLQFGIDSEQDSIVSINDMPSQQAILARPEFVRILREYNAGFHKAKYLRPMPVTGTGMLANFLIRNVHSCIC